MKNYKEIIKECLLNGQIVHDGTNVKFSDGSIIGGILVNSKDELVDTINRCLNRKDFNIPSCITD